MSNMSFGRKLRFQRLSLGLTQEEVADLIGVSRCSVTRWEEDKVFPNLAVWPRIAEVLGIPMEEIAEAYQEVSSKRKGEEVKDGNSS